MDKKRSLQYRPNINYEENYLSEFNNSTELDYTKITFKKNNEKNTNLIDKNIELLNILIDSIPTRLSNAIHEIYDPVYDIYNIYLKGQTISKVPRVKRVTFEDNDSLNNTDLDNPNDNDENDENNESNNSLSVMLNKTFTVIEVNSTETLRATVYPIEASDKRIAWSSTNTNVVTVENGVIKGISEGSATVTVTTVVGKKNANCKVVVLPKTENDNKVNAVILNKDNTTLTIGQEETLQATVYPTTAINKKIKWYTSNKQIVSVDDNGKIKGISIGNATITVVTDEGSKTDSCIVTVKNSNDNNNNNNNDNNNNNSELDQDINPDDLGDLVETKPSKVIKVEKNDLIKVVEAEFIKNLYDLINYYTSGLKDILTRYYTAIFEATSSLDDNDINELMTNPLESTKEVGINSNHLFDACVRAEKSFEHKMCFLENIFNVHQSSLHMQSFLVAYKLRQRYAKIAYNNNSSLVESISNTILKNMNVEYSEKYDDTYKNAYKFLSSSLEIISDIVDTFMASKTTRSILIKKGDIK